MNWYDWKYVHEIPYVIYNFDYGVYSLETVPCIECFEYTMRWKRNADDFDTNVICARHFSFVDMQKKQKVEKYDTNTFGGFFAEADDNFSESNGNVAMMSDLIKFSAWSHQTGKTLQLFNVHIVKWYYVNIFDHKWSIPVGDSIFLLFGTWLVLAANIQSLHQNESSVHFFLENIKMKQMSA